MLVKRERKYSCTKLKDRVLSRTCTPPLSRPAWEGPPRISAGLSPHNTLIHLIPL